MKQSVLWYLSGPIEGYLFIAALIVVPAQTGLVLYLLADPWIENEILPFLIALPLAFALPVAAVRLYLNLRDKFRQTL